MKAYDFALKDQNNRMVCLHDYTGKWVALYFYPKDDTPGCTTEACSFRDARDELAEAGAEIIGISHDEPSSHEKFKQKHSLNFSLLTDPDLEVIKAYGSWGKKRFGREGILRMTFLIDPTGRIARTYKHVNPIAHGEIVLQDLKQIQGS